MKSTLFEGDKKLLSAANQHSAHIWVGFNGKGAHVEKLHLVIREYYSANMPRALQSWGESAQGDVYTYDSSECLLQLKKYVTEERGAQLKNGRGQFDGVCGVKSVQFLDDWWSRYSRGPRAW